MAGRLPLTLGELFDLVWRRRYVALATAVVVAVVVLVWSLRKEPLYQATASLEVDRGEEAIDFSRDRDYGFVEYGFLNTERERILSTPVLTRAVHTGRLDELRIFQGVSDGAAILRSMLSVSTDRDSWVIQVTATARSPGLAEQILQAVVDSYMAQQRAAARERAESAIAFLGNQIRQREEKLVQARLAEQNFREEHEILSVDPEHNRHAIRLRRLSEQWTTLEQQLAEAQALVDQIAAARTAGGADQIGRTRNLLRIERINRHQVVNEQQNLLFKLLDQEVQLDQKYGPKHPRMIEIREQIASKRDHLSESVELAAAAIESAHRELLIQAEDLRRRIQREEELAAAYREALNGLRVKQQAVATHEHYLETLRQRQIEKEITKLDEGTQVRVQNPAEARSYPVNIRPKLALVTAIFLGLVSAVAVVLALELFDRRLRDPDQVPAILDAPVLARIPYIGELDDDRRAELLLAPPEELTEAFRHLRASLRLARRDGEWPRVLLFTSAQPGEGKSTVTAHLGRSLATAGARVLIVDGDLRAPSMHRFFGGHAEHGFSYLLVDDPRVAHQPTDIPGLTFLPSGELPPSPAELLHSACLPEAIERWRQHYDFVLIDSPPLGVVADAMTIAEHVDAVIMVARHGETIKSILRRARERLSPLADRLLGAVFNAERGESPSSYLAYHYYGGGDTSRWQAEGQVSGWRTAGTISGSRPVRATSGKRSDSVPSEPSRALEARDEPQPSTEDDVDAAADESARGRT